MLVIEAASNTTERTFITLFIPLFQPESRADGIGQLTHGLAVFGSSLLCAQEPLVVAVPAVKSLVLGRETFVTGGGADLLDHREDSTLLLVHLWSGSGEDLGCVCSSERFRVLVYPSAALVVL